MGLVAWYKLDGNANDSSGNGFNGTASNVSWVNGKIGQAGSFLVSGSKVVINPISGNILTYSAWHKWDTNSTTWRTIFGNNGNIHHLIFNNDRSVNIWDGTRRNFGYNSPDNDWHHYLVILENASNAKLYVDGIYRGETVTTLNTFNHPIEVIGNWGSNNYPVGLLDDVRIYDHALSPKEIKLLSQAKVLHLKLLDNTDASGYSSPGVETNMQYSPNSRIGTSCYDNNTFTTTRSLSFSDAPNITGDQTIAMWVYPTSNGARRNPWNKAYGGEGTITHETNGTLNYYWGTHGGNSQPYQGVNSTFTTDLNQWNHIALVRDLTNNEIRWYKNGNLERTVTASYSAATLSTAPLIIGTGYTSTYRGSIDDVRQYGTALTNEEIQEIYNERASLDNIGNFLFSEIINSKQLDENEPNELLINGGPDYEDNRNFTFFTYNSSEGGFFSRTSGSATLISPQYIPVIGNGINQFDKYKIEGEFRQPNGTMSRYYFMIVCYDKDKQMIAYEMSFVRSGTQTIVTQPVNTGDSIININDSSFWYNNATEVYDTHLKQYRVFPDNHPYPDYEYSRYVYEYKYVDTVNNIIYLNGTYNGPPLNVGNAICNTNRGGTYSYIGASNPLMTTDWVYRTGTSSANASPGSMRHGSEYIRLGFLLNRNAGVETTNIRNLKVANIDSPGQLIPYEKWNINKQGQAIFTNIDEVTGTSNGQAAQITKNGTLIINGEFREVD